MADAVVGTLRALLTLDSAQFESGVRKSSESFKTFSKTATTSADNLKSALGGIATAFAAVDFAGAINKAVAGTSKIADAAQRMGIGAEAVQRLAFAAEQGGASLEAVATSMTRMADVLGSSGGAKALESVGLSFAQIKGLTPDQTFTTIADAIARIPDPLRQSDAATTLFGRSAAQLLPAIKAGFTDIGKLAPVMSAALVKAGDEGGDKLQKLQLSMENLKAKAVLPLLSAFTGMPEAVQTGIGGLMAFMPSLSTLSIGILAVGGPAGAMAMMTKATGAMTAAVRVLTFAALGPLATAVAVAGTAFAAWKVGSWLGEITGATDAVQRLTGRLMGIDPAVTNANIAARKSAEAMKDAGAGFTATSVAVAKLPPVLTPTAAGLVKVGTAGKKAAVEVSEFEQSVGRLMQRLGGGDLVNTANEWVAAIERIGGIGRLTHDELTQFQADITKAVEKMRLMGMEIPRTWQLIADAVRNSDLLRATQDQLGGSLRSFEIYRTQLLLQTRDISGQMTAAISAVPAAIQSQNISGSLDAGLVKPVFRAAGLVENAFRTMGSAVAGLIQNMLSKISGMLSGWLDKFLPGWAAQLIGGLSTSLMSAGANALIGMAGGSSGMAGKLLGMGTSAIGLGGTVAGVGGGAGVAAGAGGVAAGAGGGVGAGGTAAGVAGGIGMGTTIAITGGAAAAALLAWAIWKKGLFRGGEEALKVNPARDQFLSPFGDVADKGATGAAHMLAAKLTELTGEAGGGRLFSDLKNADTMKKFDAAASAIKKALADAGKTGTSATDDVTDGVGQSADAFGMLTDEVNGTTNALLKMAQAGMAAAIATGDPRQMASAQANQNQHMVETAENRGQRQAGSVAALSSFLQANPHLQAEASSFLSRNPEDYTRLAQNFGIPGFHRGGFIRAHNGKYLGAPGPGEMDIRALSGEAVLNRAATRRLGGELGINALNSGSTSSASAGNTFHLTANISIDGVGQNADSIARELAPKLMREIARHNSGGSRTMFHKMVTAVP